MKMDENILSYLDAIHMCFKTQHLCVKTINLKIMNFTLFTLPNHWMQNL